MLASKRCFLFVRSAGAPARHPTLAFASGGCMLLVKTRTNACIQVWVFFIGCWTKSRDEISCEATYECGPQDCALVRRRDIRESAGRADAMWRMHAAIQ